MTEMGNSKQYDLEDRTLQFATNVRTFVKNLPKTIANIVSNFILRILGFMLYWQGGIKK